MKIIIRILTVPSRNSICGYFRDPSIFLGWKDHSSVIFEILVVCQSSVSVANSSLCHHSMGSEANGNSHCYFLSELKEDLVAKHEIVVL